MNLFLCATSASENAQRGKNYATAFSQESFQALR
jgi:hypothetical protein